MPVSLHMSLYDHALNPALNTSSATDREAMDSVKSSEVYQYWQSDKSQEGFIKGSGKQRSLNRNLNLATTLMVFMLIDG